MKPMISLYLMVWMHKRLRDNLCKWNYIRNKGLGCICTCFENIATNGYCIEKFLVENVLQNGITHFYFTYVSRECVLD